MKYYLQLSMLLLTALSAMAQDGYTNWGQAYGFKAGDERYVYADTANVRTAPQQDAAIQDKLHPGDEISILALDTILSLNGKDAPWCKVSYTKGGRRQTGYLWAGLLSPRSLSKDGVLFIYGMQFATDPVMSSAVDIKALKGHSLIARTRFNIRSIETAKGVHELKLLSSKGLKGLSCLLYFYYSGEACAVPTIEQYIGWDGRQFIVLPQVYTEGDAGAYYIEQKYTFPADKGGKPAELKMRETSEEYDEELNPVNKKVKTTRYRWDAATKKLHKL